MVIRKAMLDRNIFGTNVAGAQIILCRPFNNHPNSLMVNPTHSVPKIRYAN